MGSEDASQAELASERKRASSPPGTALVGTMALSAFVAPIVMIASVVASAYVRWLPVTARWALAMLAVVALAAPRLRARLGPRGPLLAAFALIGLAPLDWASAATSLAQPIVEVHWRCGTGDAMLLMVLPFLVGGWTVVSVLAGTIVAGLSVGPRMERVLRRLALAVTVAGVAVVGYGAVRARLPEPDQWIETRPIVATIGPNDWTNRHLAPQLGTAKSLTPPPEAWIEDAPLLGRTLHRHTVEQSSSFYFSDSANGVHVGASAGSALVVRRDDRSGIVLFVAGGSPTAIGSLEADVPRLVTVRDVASTLGPPRGWVVAAGLGVAIAAALLARGKNLGRGRDLSQARLARARDGALEFADGERWPAPRGFAGREYEVVTVLVEGAAPTDTFRRAERPRFEALVGTPDELAAGFRATRATVSAFAIAAAVTLATPLATALGILLFAGS
jgi:hypothetical protein